MICKEQHNHKSALYVKRSRGPLGADGGAARAVADAAEDLPTPCCCCCCRRRRCRRCCCCCRCYRCRCCCCCCCRRRRRYCCCCCCCCCCCPVPCAARNKRLIFTTPLNPLYVLTKSVLIKQHDGLKFQNHGLSRPQDPLWQLKTRESGPLLH